MQQLSPSDLAAWLADESRGKPMLLDVREPWEFQTCHIEGSVSMPMQTIPAQLQHLEEEMPIVCICHHGMRSMQVAYFLEQHGFTQAINLTGGVDAWARQVDPNMPKY